MNLLVVLEALLQEQSVTKAAKRIGRSQSAMSHALNRLRQTFDDPLFVSSGRGLEPTARALALLAPVEQVLDNVRDLLDPPSFDPATATSEFRIGAPDSTVMLVLSDFLARVAVEAPNMDISISGSAGSHLDALAAGRIDLAMDTFMDAPEVFHRQGLIEGRLVVVARADHPARQSEFDVEAFSRWPHVWVDTALNRSLDLHLEREKISRRCSVRTASFFTGAIVAMKTDCIMVLPEMTARRTLEFVPLAFFPVPFDLPRLGLEQMWHPRRQHDPSHMWLRRTIAEVAKSIDR
ncbi:MAG: LysR family transcriptional regulator [Bauldia litoralis]